MFETPERRSPKVDHIRQSRRDVWRLICNFEYGVLQRIKALDCLKISNIKVPKRTTTIDNEGTHGARSVTPGTKYFGGKGFGVFKTPECGSPELNQGR
jgi:hypothetical protein